MNIGIIDADLIGAKKHRFPNLASMKISAYNKNLGNDVKLITTYDEDFSQYDDIYLSKVFTATKVPRNVIELPNIHCGGTGFFYDKAPPLKEEIEHCMPDYHLYDEWISTIVERERERETIDLSITSPRLKKIASCILATERGIEKRQQKSNGVVVYMKGQKSIL